MKRFLCIMLVLLLTAAVPLVGFFALQRPRAAAVDMSRGLASLERFENVDVGKVELKIQAAELKRLQALEQKNRRLRLEEILRLLDAGKLSYRKAMKDVYIAGDSLMEGLELYDILNSNHIFAQVSASLSHLEENFNKIVSIRPPVLILHYGLNMIAADDAHAQSFIRKYTSLIKVLQKALPDTRIVVSLLFPVDRKVASAKRFGAIGKYNKLLRQMCADLGIEALDSKPAFYENGTFTTRYYGKDGIHLSASFYRNVWLRPVIRTLEIGV